MNATHPRSWREIHESQLAELEQLHDLQERTIEQIADSSSALASTIAESADTLATLIDCRLGQISWELQLQRNVLREIAAMMRSPAATQAEEWRVTAEALRTRGMLIEARDLFLRCLEPHNGPLDYRTYVGLARTYELLGEPEMAPRSCFSTPIPRNLALSGVRKHHGSGLALWLQRIHRTFTHL